MSYILTADEMKQAEILAVRQGGSFLQLMERAGMGCADHLISRMDLAGKPCVILAGRGNNGGDGFVMARILRQAEAHVTVVLAQGFPVTQEAQINFGRLEDAGAEILSLDDPLVSERMGKAVLLVDAIFGTGFHGALPQELIPLCRQYLNNRRALHVALDVPSGADIQTGNVEGECFSADLTYTFAACKTGHFLSPCEEHRGKLQVVDIGISQQLLSLTGCPLRLLDGGLVKRMLPARPRYSHKGSFGHLLAVAGSRFYTGAAVLSCIGGLRSGVGLLTVASIPHVTDTVNLRLPEAITLPLEETPSGSFDPVKTTSLLRDRLSTHTALLFGPGLGNTPEVFSLLSSLLEVARCPIVIDADGLNALSRDLSLLKKASAPIILTPHPGEMARLCGKTTAEAEANRVELARTFAREHQVILVLKGAYTVIAGPDGQILLNAAGNSGLAKGGSGDLLAGLIAGLAAGKAAPFAAAACGVYLHAKAADLCARKHSEYAMTITDVASFLGEAFLSL